MAIPIPGSSAVPTLSAYFSAWLPRHALTVSRKTIELYRYAFDRYLVVLLGAVVVTDVTREQCLDAFAAMATRKLAPNTIQLARAALSACLRDAFETHVIAAHPLVGLRMRGRAASVRKRFIPSELEYAKFMAVAERKRRDLLPCFALMSRVGLRPGEAQAARLTDVDWTGRTIRVERSADEVEADGHGPTKTRKVRVVDLPTSVLQLIQNHVDHRDGWLFPSAGRKGPLRYRTLWTVTRELCDSAGVPYIAPHSFRHYAAGAMLQLGLPLIYVSRQLGHAKLDMTAGVYANHIRLKRPSELDHW